MADPAKEMRATREAVRRVRHLSATEVVRHFSDVVNRVRYRNELVVVERGREPVCEIGPVATAPGFTGADLVDLMRNLPAPGEEYLEAVEDGIRRQPPAQGTSWRR